MTCPRLMAAVLLPSLLLPHPACGLAAAETLADAPILKERGETVADHDQRMQWFRDARFGMFIHWGLYAQLAGVWKGTPANVNQCAEWAMCGRRIPIAEYAAEARNFKPVKYDAERWVLAAKEAGVRYMVITAKHHEGFAMFASKASPFNIVDATPYGKDPLKDLSEACRKHGMKLGFYYSQNLDWHHPGGGGGEWDPAHKGDPEQYVSRIVLPQLREILTSYGGIDILWFDIPGGVINKDRADRVHKLVLECNPRIIMNNRLGGGYHGDTETPEQHIPPTGFPGRDWETCMTMNKTWGYSSLDQHWKAPEVLLHNLCDIASSGGNYLLNVGPTPEGEMPAPSLERLRIVGAWLKDNGEAIYGTRASVFPQKPAWGRFTTRMQADGSTRLYAIVFAAPKDGVLAVPGLTNQVKGASLLVGGTSLPVTQNDDGVQITVPESQRTAVDFVVTLDVAGTPKIDPRLRAGADGSYALMPWHAAVTGSLCLEGAASAGLHSANADLGCWTDAASTATWALHSTAPQEVRVRVKVAAPDTSAGSVVEVVCGDHVLPVTIPATGGWSKYQEVDAGTCLLPAGNVAVMVRCKVKKGEAPCNIAWITLSPVK